MDFNQLKNFYKLNEFQKHVITCYFQTFTNSDNIHYIDIKQNITFDITSTSDSEYDEGYDLYLTDCGSIKYALNKIYNIPEDKIYVNSSDDDGYTVTIRLN